MKKICVYSIALVLSILMSSAGVFIGNFPYSIADETSWLCVGENIVRRWFNGAEDSDDAYFVNVGYDKQIIDVEVSPLESGHMVITDRKVLLDFLDIADRADYKYIFLDIRFEKGFETVYDSALFAKIASMRDIVCAYHYEPLVDEQGIQFNGFEIADTTLLPKCAYNDYFTSVLSSNFTRYAYLQEGRTSVALRMYQDINGKTVRQHGCFYYNDGAPCENCPYIPIWGRVSPVTCDSVTSAQYYNLGPFLMTLPEQQLIADMKGKIVVVGDFEEDTHDTYMSMQPGPYLTYLAYKYLARGGNNISFPVILLMALVYFLMIKFILEGRPLIPWCKYRIIRILAALLSYSFILLLICIIVFLITGYAFNVMIPSFVISCVSAVKDSKDKPSEKTAEK
jgi:hypothetical protein